MGSIGIHSWKKKKKKKNEKRKKRKESRKEKRKKENYGLWKNVSEDSNCVDVDGREQHESFFTHFKILGYENTRGYLWPRVEANTALCCNQGGICLDAQFPTIR
jgi:hypothetical protein